MKQKYAHFMKLLKFQDGPEGLYPSKLYWVEAKDMEGFNCCFAFTYITEPCVFHPVEGMVTHPYDEIMVFASVNHTDIISFNAELSIELGAEREKYTFNEPTVVIIPAGLPHGPVRVERLGEPITHFTVSLCPNYSGTYVPAGEPVEGSRKYAALVRKHLAHKSQMDNQRAEEGDTGKPKVLDARGVLHPRAGGVGPGNGDQIVWMHGEDLDGLDVNFAYGFYSHTGKWHRGGEVHLHPEEEILIFLSGDPQNPEDLGMEAEFGMGPEIDRYILNKPGLFVAPKGFPHLPMITRWCDKPYLFMVICMDGAHASPWAEADLDAMIASGEYD